MDSRSSFTASEVIDNLGFYNEGYQDEIPCVLLFENFAKTVMPFIRAQGKDPNSDAFYKYSFWFEIHLYAAY